MARPPRSERRPAKLQCNNCGHQFVGQAWFVSIESEEGSTIGWNQDRGARGALRVLRAAPHSHTFHEANHPALRFHAVLKEEASRIGLEVALT